MKIKILFFIMMILIVTGCAKKVTKLDSSNYDFVKQQVIESTSFKTIKDPVMNYSWVTSFLITYNSKNLIEDERKLNFFYHAHNADIVYIFANKKLADIYAYYLAHNGVSAQIITYDFIENEANLVNIIFKHK